MLDVASPAVTTARLWDRFRGAFWTLLDQGTISLGTFLVNVQLARQLDASEYGTFALLFGSYFLLQLINAALIFFPLMLKLADSKEERSSGLVFVSLILTTLTTCSFTAVVVSCLIFFDRSELAFAAAAAAVRRAASACGERSTASIHQSRSNDVSSDASPRPTMFALPASCVRAAMSR